MVGHGGLDRDIDRMVKMDQLDRRAEADPAGEPGRLAHHQVGRGDGIDPVDVGPLAVMLADIGVAESKLVGEDDLVDVLLIRPGGAGVRPDSIGKDAEFHPGVPRSP